MINLVPQCVKCGSPVSDLVEPEIQEHGGDVKPGHYINSTWICNECSQRNNTEKIEQIGKASTADVSPNTPTADGT